MLYRTKTLDLRPFGVSAIKRAILTADADDGLTYRVSFDAGRSWRVAKLNTPFVVPSSNNQIKVEIRFPKNDSRSIYTVSASGVFPLSVGTTVYFENGDSTFTTVIGFDGRYNVSLPKGIYTVYYRQSGTRVELLNDFNPESYAFRQPDDLDKENTIQMFLSTIEWADYSVYDTFKDQSKMGDDTTAKIDIMQNLTADNTDKAVRYWALAFEA